MDFDELGFYIFMEEQEQEQQAAREQQPQTTDNYNTRSDEQK